MTMPRHAAGCAAWTGIQRARYGGLHASYLRHRGRALIVQNRDKLHFGDEFAQRFQPLVAERTVDQNHAGRVPTRGHRLGGPVETRNDAATGSTPTTNTLGIMVAKIGSTGRETSSAGSAGNGPY
jgi:hypothetical protein